MKMPLYEQIYRYLLAEIDQGRLRPGDRVLSEKELAAKFKVSRITSKKALEKLAQEGVIQRARGRGSFVARRSSTAMGAPPGALRAAATVVDAASPPRLIGFLLPDFSDTFGAHLLRTLETHLRRHGMRLLVCRTEGNRAQEEAAVDDCLRLGVAGLLVFPVYGEYYNEHLLRLVFNRFPIVLVDRSLHGIPVCSIRTNHRQAAEDLTNHLVHLGHRHIAFVSLPAAGTSSIEERVQGIMAALAVHGVSFLSEEQFVPLYCTLPGAFTPSTQHVERDEAIVRDYILAHPEVTAFIGCEYPLALLVHRVLGQLGFTVPGDYSVACFDSPQLPLDVPATITHIRQDEESIGRQAVARLIEQIEGNEVPSTMITGHLLIVGGSTGCVRQGAPEGVRAPATMIYTAAGMA